MTDIEAAGGVALAMDVTEDAAVIAGVERVLHDQGRIDVLINNAGYGQMGALEDVPMDVARRQIPEKKSSRQSRVDRCNILSTWGEICWRSADFPYESSASHPVFIDAYAAHVSRRDSTAHGVLAHRTPQLPGPRVFPIPFAGCLLKTPSSLPTSHAAGPRVG